MLDPTLIFHITHVDNLASIVREGGLQCDRQSDSRRAQTVSISHQHIKERRARKRVPLPPGGTLHDYVPFYFAPRSPMLYSISRGNVAGYTEGQRSVVHLVGTAEAVDTAGLAFVFTDGHAVMDLSDFYENMQQLDKVDWGIMRAKYWSDTDEDGDRKRRRQAEFLVHNFFPWSLVTRIGVYCAETATRVEKILRDANHKPLVNTEPSWYY